MPDSPGAEEVAIDSLEPGTTVIVNTRNSQYRCVILSVPQLLLVRGGAMFPEATIVRFEGSILVGSRMEMSLGPMRIRSSPVRSVSIERQERPLT